MKMIFFLYYEKKRSRINLEKLNKKSLKSTVYIKRWQHLIYIKP